MSKPQMNTPVHQVISLLDALDAWFKTHHPALADALDAKRDHQAELTAAHSALTATQALFEREQKEDVAATIEVDDAIARGVSLLVSANKLAQAALREHPQRKRLMRQIIEFAPSTRRTANTVTEALKLASAGLTRHADKFDGRAALHARIIQRADALIAELADDQKLRKKEQVESRAASADRDLALKTSLALITALDDGAQAIYFEAPAPYNTLRVLYDIHCPAPPQADAADDDEDDLTQPGNDPSQGDDDAG